MRGLWARSIVALGAVSSALALGCSESTPQPRVEREQRGDTTIVRTLAGSVWGDPAELVEEVRIGRLTGDERYTLGRVAAIAVDEAGSIYVTDVHVPAVRKYAADGSYLATLGRDGEGPGEYRAPDGGLGLLPDGRLVVRDPGNARFQLYDMEGAPAGTWRMPGGVSTSDPLTVDTTGRVYSKTYLEWPGRETRREVVLGYDPASGQPVDTIPVPESGFEAARLRARRITERGPSYRDWYVPFSPTAEWAFSPLGYMITAVSTRYAIDEHRPDGTVLRIERRPEPVPVQPGERRDAERRAIRAMRDFQPDWRWNGPPIPETKPPFSELFVGLDGRIWVMASQPGERIPDEEIGAVDPAAPPPERWREPVAFDVFEPDGTYLGRVRAPSGFAIFPRPVFRGDHVWGVVRDELDVAYVVRLRVSSTPR